MTGAPPSFRAAVMESDLGHRIDDLLAVQLNYNPQDTVCTRMLRSEVQKDEVASVTAALMPTLRGGTAATPVPVLLLFGKVKGPHLSGARGMVFSQWMPYPASRHQYALQVGVPGKRYSEHVPYFTFVPIRRRPKARECCRGTARQRQEQFSSGCIHFARRRTSDR